MDGLLEFDCLAENLAERVGECLEKRLAQRN